MRATPTLRISRENTSLRQQVINTLRDAIVSGQFEPGTRMIERDLCESLGISRTLIREALQHLTAEGLITTVPHKGPTVATLDADDVRSIYEVRRSLEGLAGAGFARHASALQMAELRQAFEFLRTPEASASTDALLQAKNRFYGVLLAGCGNKIVAQMLVQLNNRITMLRRRTLSQAGRLGQTLVELDAVVRAIEARDTERARFLCEEHVSRAAEVLAASFAAAPATPVAAVAQTTPVAPVAPSH